MQGRTKSVIILYQCDQNDVTAAVTITGTVIEIVIAATAGAALIVIVSDIAVVVAIEAVLVMARTSQL